MICTAASCAGSCLAQGMCCCFSCCCQQLSQAFRRLLGLERVTKLFYLFLVAIFTIPAIVVLFFINQWQSFISYFSWLSCPSGSGGQFDCVGPSAIYRLSLSILCLFGLMFIITLTRSRFAMVMNEGIFCFKYLLVLGLFIGFLWIQNSIFESYSIASKYISIVFMIIQSIILIDLFYMAGIKLVAHYDQGQVSYAGILIFLSVFFEGVAIALNILGYVYFSQPDLCGDSLWVNIVTTIILVILPSLQFFNFNKQNSLLTTALVGMYVSYLCFISQFSFGRNTCIQRMTVQALTADIIVSTFFFILTMYGSIMGGTGQVKVTRNGDINVAMGVADTDRPLQNQQKPQQVKIQAKDVQQSEVANLAKYTSSWNWVKWHFYMCLASMYIGMLVTNWTSASITTGDLISNDFGFWVRVTIAWGTTLLYIWTLIAPRVCPSRDFTVI